MSAAQIANEEFAETGSPEERVYRAFVRALSTLNDVVLTAFERDGDGMRIWTVIDADPEDRAACYRVYEAELAASDVAPDALVDFRLLNRREYTPDVLLQILPACASMGRTPPAP